MSVSVCSSEHLLCLIKGSTCGIKQNLNPHPHLHLHKNFLQNRKTKNRSIFPTSNITWTNQHRTQTNRHQKVKIFFIFYFLKIPGSDSHITVSKTHLSYFSDEHFSSGYSYSITPPLKRKKIQEKDGKKQGNQLVGRSWSNIGCWKRKAKSEKRKAKSESSISPCCGGINGGKVCFASGRRTWKVVLCSTQVNKKWLFGDKFSIFLGENFIVFLLSNSESASTSVGLL